MLRIFLLFGLFFSLGCAGKLVPLAPGNPIEMDSNEGLLLLSIETGNELNEVVFMGKRWKKIPKEALTDFDYYLVVLRAGNYRFSEFEIEIPEHLRSKTDYASNLSASTEYDEARDWNFEVKAGKINYAGHYKIFEIYRSPYTMNFRVGSEASNRSSFAYVYMKEKRPEVFEKYDMVWGGFGEDSFFEEIAKYETVAKGVTQ